MNTTLDKFRPSLPLSNRETNEHLLEDDDSHKRVPRYPSVLTRPLKSILPHEKLKPGPLEGSEDTSKHNEPKLPNFSEQRTNHNSFSDKTLTESEDHFFEMKSSPFLQFFSRLFRLITTMKIKKISPRVSLKRASQRHSRLREDESEGHYNEALY
ncbi:hypothetical protein Aperf_G00000034331 [Anoplocephala perfoliata]